MSRSRASVVKDDEVAAESRTGAERDKPHARGGRRRFDRYDTIVQTAAELFCRKGYDATGLQEIADAVGLLKGSVYYYIDSKEDLLFAVLKQNHDRIISQNTAWQEVTDDPVAAIRTFIEGHIRLSLQNGTVSEVFIREFRSLSPSRAEELRRLQEPYADAFRSLVEAAIEAGRLRPGVTPGFASRAVFGMTNWIHRWYRPEGPLSLEDVVREMSDYAMASLLGPVR